MTMQPEIVKTLSTLVDGQPLSGPTLKAGRQLLVVSSICILLTVYGVTVSIPNIREFADPSRNKLVLTGALSVVVAYLFVKFWLDAFDDLARWYGARDKLILNNWYSPLTEAKEHCNRVRQLLDVMNQALIERGEDVQLGSARIEMEGWVREGAARVQNAREIAERVEKKMDEVVIGHKSATVVQWILLVMNLLTPTGLAILALVHVRTAFVPFIAELISTVR